jgi:hypothetical protein
MNIAFLDVLANHGATLITHIALFDGASEITGGSPAYARQAVTWTTASGDGLIRPDANLDFDIPAGATVDGWRGFTALSGGTDYDGDAVTAEAYAGQGVYTLLAASTAIDLDAA